MEKNVSQLGLHLVFILINHQTIKLIRIDRIGLWFTIVLTKMVYIWECEQEHGNQILNICCKYKYSLANSRLEATFLKHLTHTLLSMSCTHHTQSWSVLKYILCTL